MSDERIQELKKNEEILLQSVSKMEQENQRIITEADDKEASWNTKAQEAIEASNKLQGELDQAKKENSLNRLKLEIPGLQKLSDVELEDLKGNSFEELKTSGEAYLAQKKERDAETLKAYGLDPEAVMKDSESQSPTGERTAPMEMKPANTSMPEVSPVNELEAQIEEVRGWKNPEARKRGGPSVYNLERDVDLVLERFKQQKQQARN